METTVFCLWRGHWIKRIPYAKGVKEPRVFPMPGGGFGITASRVNENGSADEECEGRLLLWTTDDFIAFREMGFADPGQLPEGARAGNTVEVSRSLCDRAALHWSRLSSVAVHVPDKIPAHDAEAVEKIKATVVYSDGSTAQKRVRWDVRKIDFGRKGTCRIAGTVINEQYAFPLACGFGDPVVFPWEGRYYYISTNDNLNDVGFYVREAGTVADLFKEDAKQHLILDLDEERGLVQTFWAPEFHVIGGELYILFAVSGTQWGPQCHLMKLKKRRQPDGCGQLGGSDPDPEKGRKLAGAGRYHAGHDLPEIGRLFLCGLVLPKGNRYRI